MATPIELPVIQPAPDGSFITVELCVNDSCDDDSSPVVGTIAVRLDPTGAPTSIELVDFELSVTETTDLAISFGPFGGITATGSDDITLNYEPPEDPLSTAVAGNGDFSFAAVPASSTGTVAYNATGLVCVILQGAELLCNDTADLADQGVQTGMLSGNVTVSPDRIVTIAYQPNLLFDVVPGSATVEIVGDVTAQVQVPLRGDANLDGDVDGRDAQRFVAVMLDPAGATWQERFAVDMDDDDAFDADDAAALVSCLLTENCPA
jgi:hypothetical protein